jgi:hypothetical protein
MSEPDIFSRYSETFIPLRAESEPWLEQVYVPPANFPIFISQHSTLILGEKGSGKSALLRAIRRSLAAQKVLVVEWTWDPLAWAGKRGIEALRVILEQLMSQIAYALLITISSEPSRWESLIPSTREMFHWFFFRYLIPHRDLLWVEPTPDKNQLQIFLDQFSHQPSVKLPESTSPVRVLGYLVPLFLQAQFTALGIMLEDVAPWAEADPDITTALKSFLSSLAVFDVRSLFFKIVLDESLYDLVRTSEVISRRRVELVHLRWPQDLLEQIVIHRLQHVLGKGTDLGILCQRNSLLAWLSGCGGESPQAWLRMITPAIWQILQIKVQEGEFRAMTPQEWKEVRSRNLPDLTYDLQTGKVKIGWRTVELKPAEEVLFRYLLEHRGKVCSPGDLYQVYKQHNYPNTPPDELEVTDRGMMDNALYRLRNAIEPDPRDPILLITRRRKGICLK